MAVNITVGGLGDQQNFTDYNFSGGVNSTNWTDPDIGIIALAKKTAEHVASAFVGQSSTSQTIRTGLLEFTSDVYRAYHFVGCLIHIYYAQDNTKWMRGTVVDSDEVTGVLSVQVTSYSGSGTYSDWNIQIDFHQARSDAAASASSAATSAAQALASKQAAEAAVGQVTVGSTTALSFPAVAKRLPSAWNSSGVVTAYGANDYVTSFVYDTRNDSDGGAWRFKCKNTSWYNETLNTATRGSRREFPMVVLIVARTSYVVIYDALDLDTNGCPKMWMVFILSGWYALAAYGVSSFYAINGKLFVGANYTNSGGLTSIDFIKDLSLLRIDNTNAYSLHIIGQRNVAISDGETDYWQPLVHKDINSIHGRILPGAPLDPISGLPIPTIAVATTGGISVIHPSGVVADITSFAQAPTSVFIFNDDEMLARGSSADSLAIGNIPYADITAAVWMSEIYGNGGSIGCAPYIGRLLSGSVTTLEPTGKFVGMNTGLVSIYRPYKGQNTTSVAHITTKYNSGWMPGDIRGAWIGNNTTGNITASGELITNGTFTSNTDGWTPYGDTSFSIASGMGRVTRTVTSNYISQTFTTVSGETYNIYVSTSGQARGRIVISNPTINIFDSGELAAGDHILQFTANSSSSKIALANSGSSGQYTDFDNVSVKLAVPDLSYKSKPLVVNGTLTNTTINTNCDLVAINGFGASNYLEQAYNSGLDFGTGDFCIMWWGKYTKSSSTWHFERGYYSNPNYYGSGFRVVHSSTDNNNLLFQTSGNGFSSVITTSFGVVNYGYYKFFTVTRKKGIVETWVNGIKIASSTNTTNLSNQNAVLRIGAALSGTVYDDTLSITLLRISAYAPTKEQIEKIYSDEKLLFNPGTKCVLGGTSSAVKSIAQDSSTDSYFVATDDGVSEFDGLVRAGYKDGTSVGSSILTSDTITSVSAAGKCLLITSNAEAVFIQDSIIGKEEVLNNESSYIDNSQELSVNTINFNSVVKKLPSAWNSYGVPTAYGASDYVTSFVYDTRKDSDGGAWRFRCQHTSWYNETLNTATRGSRREFPMVALIVARTYSVTIYDAIDLDNNGCPKMWMVFVIASYYSISHFGPSAIFSIDGRALVGSNASNAGGLAEIDFVKDFTLNRVSSTTGFYPHNILDRNTANTNTLLNYYQGLVHRDVNSVHAKVIPGGPLDPVSGLPIPTIAVATTAGVSVIYPSGKVWDITSFSQAPNAAFINKDNELFSRGSSADSVATGYIPYTDTLSSSWMSEIYGNGGSSEYSPYIGRLLSGSVTAIDPNARYIGMNVGLVSLYRAYKWQNTTSVSHITTSSNSGWQPGDIRGAWIGNTSSTNIAVSNLITNGTFDSNTSGWSAFAGATLSVSSGELVITTDGTNYSQALQNIPTVIGERYVIRYTMRRGTCAGTVWVGAANYEGTVNYCAAGNPSTSSITGAIDFTAAGTTTRIFVHMGEGNSNGQTAYFDNISVVHSKGSVIGSGELVTNGTFTTNTNGWTAGNGATLSVVSGAMRITGGTTDYPLAYCSISTIIGETYTVTCDFLNNTSASAHIGISSSPLGTEINISSSASSGKLIFNFAATTTTTYVICNLGTTDNASADFDNVSVKLAIPDLSYKARSLIVNGILTKSNVATDSDLVAISGFSTSNYLEQPYNSDLDFGTGDFSFILWAYNGFCVNRGYYTGGNYSGARIRFVNTGSLLRFAITSDAATYNYNNCDFSTSSYNNSWTMFTGVKRGSTLELWANNSLVATQSVTVGSLTNANATLMLGKEHDNSVWGLAHALLRISAYAPTPQQIRKIYEDEKHLFTSGTKCTLGGTSNNVVSLSFDESTNITHVGTSDGVSEFSGLIRTGYRDGVSVGQSIMSSDTVTSVSAAGGCQLITTSAEALFRQDSLVGKEEVIRSRSLQSSNNVLKATIVTTDATATDLSPRIEIGERELVMIESRILGRVYGAADGQRISYIRKATYYRDAGGNVTLQGSVQTIGTDTEVTSTADATFNIDTTAQTVAIRVTGVASTRIVWSSETTITRYSEDQDYA